MPDFYYQIKGKVSKDKYSFSNWEWPPIFSDKVAANSKAEARKIIEKAYGHKFPLRVLTKDLDSAEFLMKLTEIKEDDLHIKRLFEVSECKKCGKQYKIIDKYNDINCKDKSPDFCSEICSFEYRKIAQFTYNEDQNLSGKHVPVIYRITNHLTEKCYIGKTTQAFTFRWYQHFFQGGDSKFHKAITESDITHWRFEIVEIVKLPGDTKSLADADAYIRERESWHIWANKSVENGYNTLK